VAQVRSAALLIRVWQEADPDAFRARLSAIDASAGAVPGAEETVAVASTEEQVIDAVRRWLGALSGGAE
jgi:hypothetical protein